MYANLDRSSKQLYSVLALGANLELSASITERPTRICFVKLLRFNFETADYSCGSPSLKKAAFDVHDRHLPAASKTLGNPVTREGKFQAFPKHGHNLDSLRAH